MKQLLILFVGLFILNPVKAQQIIRIYPNDIPNCIANLRENQVPTLEVYLPAKEKATGTAMLVIPGGGYQFLAYIEEGTTIAKSLVEKGIAAFVLKYRLPSDKTMKDKTIGSLQDAQQSIKTLRLRAKEWDLDPSSIGVIGFSAGGHLAGILGTKFNKSYILNSENINLRPDFLLLVYPVITMDSKMTHMGSRQNLLGLKPTYSQVWSFSVERQVSFDTPPTYLTHCGDDNVVDVNNSIEMYKALVNNRVPAEMHLYPKGNHGFIQTLPVDEWLDPMLLWLQKEGFYKKKISK